ncbi:imidazolonepropionase-like amidohydrolase [Kribbella sp. VKM Ac-2569]|uniref:metal-dependent hydrolase family protein n=1 Tax=Kribbella sp. VKM Ac-2569 TaxID=2512220 RepID=UPI00102CD532|nr:amidohydrolase family protein [Kribbella sp. VKM Ac-2569]RZT07930.1 imidazolonepropionase-like amidohydrolase [Kribbella sp. VKM Ac-2569]
MLALRAARLFDGHNAALISDATVLVAEGRILAVRSGGGTPDRAEVVELGDVTLLPGLIDAHLHLGFDASADPVDRLTTASDDELLAGMRKAARTALAAGVTTVRDLGDRDYLALRLRTEYAADPASGPQVLAAGPPITITGGHCWFLGGQADGVAGVRAAVRTHAERGVDVIKIMASGGELTPGTHSHQAQYSTAELRAAVEEAHRLGLPVTAHAHAADAITNAVAAGVDSLEHCTFMTPDGIEDRPDLVEAIATAGITVSLTLGIRPGTVPPPRIAARLAGLSDHFQRLRVAGIPLVCTTDAGIGPPKPHDILPHAVTMMVERVGNSTLDALRAVTSLPARLCRIDDHKGRLAPGYDADILAVAGNPLTDPAALLDVRAVYRHGQRAH